MELQARFHDVVGSYSHGFGGVARRYERDAKRAGVAKSGRVSIRWAAGAQGFTSIIPDGDGRGSPWDSQTCASPIAAATTSTNTSVRRIYLRRIVSRAVEAPKRWLRHYPNFKLRRTRGIARLAFGWLETHDLQNVSDHVDKGTAG